jgi:hypothetical protein
MATEPTKETQAAPPPRKALPKAAAENAAPNGRPAPRKDAGANGQANADGRPHLELDQSPRRFGLGAAIKNFLRQSPSWLTSMVVHVVLLLVLGLVIMPTEVKNEIQHLMSGLGDDSAPIDDATPQDVTGDALDGGNSSITLNPTQHTEAVAQFGTPLAAELVGTPGVGTDLDNGPAAELQMDGPGGLGQNLFTRPDGTGGGGTGAGGMGIRSRGTADGKRRAMQDGATAGSEKAVALALKWIAEHQIPDGGWSFDHRPGKCGGRCKDHGTLRDGRFAATGLALMSFLGAGQTHKQGEYKENVYRGLQFLTRNQNPQTGQMFRPGENMYAHGIATIALCEACGMTDDKALLPYCRKAVGFIMAAQDRVGGGWRYTPNTPGDTSAVGWQIMALKSAKWAYIKLDNRVIAGANAFLNSVQVESGAKYGYDKPGAGPATTAIGLLCRMHLGWKKDNPALEKGVKFLSEMGPSKNNAYYNYYATQVMRHWQGQEWIKWNTVMREYLIGAQATQGHEAGSWFLGKGGDIGADVGGRHYFTCMNCMTLEVYYRYFPLYQTKSTEDDFDN